MDEKYFPEKIENKWQQHWAETNAFVAGDDDPRADLKNLEMLRSFVEPQKGTKSTKGKT